MRLVPKPASIDILLLDPNNYRFHDLPAWKRVAATRYHETKVQEQTAKLLRSTAVFELSALKDSIRTNGFVPLEQIVVRPYEAKEGSFVVVEGNRRVAAILWLLEDQESGIVTLSEEEQKRLREIDVLYLDVSDPENAHAVEVLMAIRHVSGIKEWGAYQQARLVVELMSSAGATFRSVGEKLAMNAREVARRFRASKALAQMEADPEFKESAEPSMYAIFHETVAQPIVRDWLEWDDTQYQFKNRQNLYDFYSLMCGADGQEPKVRGYEDVRTKIKQILPYPRALRILLDPAKTMDDAFEAAIKDAGTGARAGRFEPAIRSSLDAVETMPAATLRTLSQEQRKLLEDLAARIQQALADSDRLQGTQA